MYLNSASLKSLRVYKIITTYSQTTVVRSLVVLKELIKFNRLEQSSDHVRTRTAIEDQNWMRVKVINYTRVFIIRYKKVDIVADDNGTRSEGFRRIN